MDEIELDILWYAAGQLDGDGCVLGTDNGKKLKVCMDKAELGKSSLEWFQKYFGGNYRKSRNAKDKHQAVFDWTLHGESAVLFCKLISSFTQIKKPQFQLASSFPSARPTGRPVHLVNNEHISKNFDSIDDMRKDPDFPLKRETIKKWVDDHKYPRSLKDRSWKLTVLDPLMTASKRKTICDDLKALKKEEHKIITDCLPAPYFAGLFDAEGDVSLVGLNGISLTFTQKYRPACDAFAKRYGGCVSKSGGYHWTICKREEVKRYIVDILPYVVEKKKTTGFGDEYESERSSRNKRSAYRYEGE